LSGGFAAAFEFSRAPQPARKKVAGKINRKIIAFSSFFIFF
jgi:hypothetical protein